MQEQICSLLSFLLAPLLSLDLRVWRRAGCKCSASCILSLSRSQRCRVRSVACRRAIKHSRNPLRHTRCLYCGRVSAFSVWAHNAPTNWFWSNDYLVDDGGQSEHESKRLVRGFLSATGALPSHWRRPIGGSPSAAAHPRRTLGEARARAATHASSCWTPQCQETLLIVKWQRRETLKTWTAAAVRQCPPFILEVHGKTPIDSNQRYQFRSGQTWCPDQVDQDRTKRSSAAAACLPIAHQVHHGIDQSARPSLD